MRLEKDFYKRGALELAKDLLGKYLVRELDGEEVVCKIVETEAYVGPHDKGCHAYNNKRTKRTETMFMDGGYAYVYQIYGMYFCLNVVARDEDIPEAVLIRAVEPVEGLDRIKVYRSIKSRKVEDLTNGPGKLCQGLSIDKKLDKYDLIEGTELYIRDNPDGTNHEVVERPRINIDYAEEYKDKLWRFYIKGNKFVSKK